MAANHRPSGRKVGPTFRERERDDFETDREEGPRLLSQSPQDPRATRRDRGSRFLSYIRLGQIRLG